MYYESIAISVIIINSTNFKHGEISPLISLGTLHPEIKDENDRCHWFFYQETHVAIIQRAEDSYEESCSNF